MIRNHFRQHSLVYQLLLILGGTVALGGGIILVVKSIQSTRETAYDEPVFTKEEILAAERKPAEQTFRQPIGNERYSLRQILDFTLEAHGGRDALESIRSLRRKGSVVLFRENEPREPVETTVVFQRPDKLRYSYSSGPTDYLTSFDGEDGWWQISSKTQESAPEAVNAENLLLLRQDVITVRPISMTLTDTARLSLLPEEEGAEPLKHYRIRYDLGWMRETIFINKVNFLSERRESEIFVEGGDPVRVALRYGDFRYVDGMAFPFETAVELNGKKSNEFTLDSIEINIGVLEQVFSRPPG